MRQLTIPADKLRKRLLHLILIGGEAGFHTLAVIDQNQCIDAISFGKPTTCPGKMPNVKGINLTHRKPLQRQGF